MKRTTRTKTSRNKNTVTAPIEDNLDEITMTDEGMAVEGQNASPRFRLLPVVIAILILAAIGYYKFSYLLVPAKVNNKPIYIWTYIMELHKAYGKDAISTLTTQELLNQEIKKSGVSVSGDEIQKEVNTLDKQASASGGLKTVLVAQGITMDQLKDQIRIQLAVKKILKDKIAVTDAEVDDTYAKNKDFFKGVPLAEAKSRVRAQIENQKFQAQASAWLADLKKKSTIEIAFPSLKAATN